MKLETYLRKLRKVICELDETSQQQKIGIYTERIKRTKARMGITCAGIVVQAGLTIGNNIPSHANNYLLRKQKRG